MSAGAARAQVVRERPFMRLLSACFTLAAVIALGFYLRTQWSNVQPTLLALRWMPLALSVPVLCAGFLLIPLVTMVASQIMGSPLDYRTSLVAYFQSQPAKYLPGGVWVYPKRLHSFKNSGLSIGRGAGILLLESLTLVMSSAFIGALAYSRWIWTRFGAITVAVALVAPWILLIVIVLMLRLRQSQPDAQVSVKRQMWRLSLGMLAGCGVWITLGLSLELQLASVHQPIIDSSGSVWLAGSFALAWLIGFVTPVAPGGLGAREAALILLLKPLVGATTGTIVSLVARLTWTAGEALMYALSFVQQRSTR